MSLTCPKCDDATLQALVVDEIEVDRCPDCEGIWFDQAELGNLLDADDERVKPLLKGSDDDNHDQVLGDCPRDGERMIRVVSARNHRVVLDLCGKCKGIWLDGGEFRRIKKAAPDARLGELV